MLSVPVLLATVVSILSTGSVLFWTREDPAAAAVIPTGERSDG